MDFKPLLKSVREMIYFFARPVRKLKILGSKARFETRETTNRMDTQQTFDFVWLTTIYFRLKTVTRQT